MQHTLAQLKSGELKGTTSLKLACGLESFPEEIFELADTLEVLDLSDNNLSCLPERVSELKQLKIIFFARNVFTEFPAILAKCPALRMIGFKSNTIKTVPENAFPPLMHWLILTDNCIETLPDSLGESVHLQKCALAGNRIKVLPETMAKCKNLELLRISANNLTTIPKWLFQLPKLSWVAFGGNPGAEKSTVDTDLASYSWTDFKIQDLLGEGASGLISKAHWTSKNKAIALKVFKGAVTSDGLPDDEMAVSIAAGSHSSLIEVLGKIKAHPESKSGLIMKLIAPSFINLGNPPSLESCTRDVFNKETVFNEKELLKIAKSIASVSAQLHSKGINHGDLYAHNILINQDADCLLGDFGAASFYNENSDVSAAIERVEVRAYGCLLEDVLNLVPEEKLSKTKKQDWQNLINDCMQTNVNLRPSFSEILERLN